MYNQLHPNYLNTKLNRYPQNDINIECRNKYI